MRIQFETGKPLRIDTTATEKRGLRSTLEMMLTARKHLEEPFNPDEDIDGYFHGTAALLLHDGFEDFVNRYAPPAPEPAKSKGVKKGTPDGT